MYHREIIKTIKAPTMVIAGKQDAGTRSRWDSWQEHPGASMTLFDAATSQMSSSRTTTPMPRSAF